jgi:hypothetical protein
MSNINSGTATPNNEAAAPFNHGISDKAAKTHNKNLWSQLKHAVVEHHRSVNRAYQATYGAGIAGSRSS